MKNSRNRQRNDIKEVDIEDFNSGERPEKKKKKKKRSINKEFAIVTYSFLLLFIAMSAYFVYFVQVESKDFINSPYNARLKTMETKVSRGDILSNDGQVLATSVTDETGNEARVYPYGALFAHVVGFESNGKSGIELDENYELLSSNSFILNRIKNEVFDSKNPGDSVVTTLDVNLQQACYNAIGSYKGAAICIDPDTGKVLAMVSKPDFDPNYVGQNWDNLVSDDNDDAVLLNRATQGLYAPGSTFKIFTLLSYINQKGEDFQFDCNGAYSLGEYEMHCYNGKAHGSENLMQAFGNSCNSAFSQMGLELDVTAYRKLCQKLMFNQKLPTRMKLTAKSRFDLQDNSPSALVMQTAIGQGDTMVSPLHMAMIAAAIANDGKLMEPYLIDSIQNKEGATIKEYSAQSKGEIISSQDAQVLKEYMRYVVTDGTATPLVSEQYEAFGKTGTAEFGSDKTKDHSWFVGFAKDANGKDIAIAVVMENVESGNSYAVPATRQILDAYFSVVQ